VKLFQKNNIYKIQYTTKATGQYMERKVIPIMDVTDTVLTLDVTDLTTEQTEELIEVQREYAKYVETHMEQMFDFKTWVEHTRSATVPDNWNKIRSFSLSNIHEINKESREINDK